MDKFSKTIYDKVLILDWDGVIDLTSDEKYAYELGRIDYRTTREYLEKLKQELDSSEITSNESFDDAQKRYADQIRFHYSLKDKYLLERNDSKLMESYNKSIKEIAKMIIKKDLKDENLEELIEVLKDEFPKEDKYFIGRYVGLLSRIRRKVTKEVDEILSSSLKDEEREELIDYMMELELAEIEGKIFEVYGRIPYRKIIRNISEESEKQVIELANSGRYGLTIIGSHYNVSREVYFKNKLIQKLFSKYGIIFIPIPFYPTILKDGLNKEEIDSLKSELEAFDINVEQENAPTSKTNYVRYFLYKYFNIFIDDPSQITLIDNSSRNVSDCNEKGGIGIYFKPGTDNDTEVGSLELNEVINAENNLIYKRRK